MMLLNNIAELSKAISGTISISDRSRVEIENSDTLRGELIDRLAYNASLNPDGKIKEACAYLIRAAARAMDIHPSSIQGLYEAMGRGDCGGFTVPAINVRMLTYDVGRMIFRAANAMDVGAFIFEIARTEMGYTDQPPPEYVSSVLSAAIKEGYTGPVFIQGDHFQINAAKYAQDPEEQMNVIRDIITRAIAAGFYNIDIDTSTLVDLSKPTLDEQQKLNYELVAYFTEYIRNLEPDGITISVGGEIGEVGKQNSTEEELCAFMDGLTRELEKKGGNMKGISKISVQSGTSHGGVVLPDGSIAEVSIDLDTLKRLSAVAREKYGLSGAVQHGASTLPSEAFDNFPKTGTAEIHLATEFQNMVYDNQVFPEDLKQEIYAYLQKTFAGERKDKDTEEQFIYKTRKKGWGPFKEKCWNLPADIMDPIMKTLEDKFTFLFDQLNVEGSRSAVDKYIEVVTPELEAPEALAALK